MNRRTIAKHAHGRSVLAVFILVVWSAITLSQTGPQPVTIVAAGELMSADTAMAFTQVGEIASDRSGNIFVTDKLEYRIMKFDAHGRFHCAFGNRGREDYSFQGGPYMIDSHADTLAIADAGTSHIKLFSTTMTFLRDLTLGGPILDLAFDNRGYLYASMFRSYEESHEIVACYRSTGELVARYPLPRIHRDPPFNLVTIAVDARNRLIVAYKYLNLVAVYNDTRTLVSTFSIDGLPQEPTTMRFEGSGAGSIPETEIFNDVSVDNRGWIYLLAGGYSTRPNRDVYVVDGAGNVKALIQLPSPTGIIHIGKAGFLYTRERHRTVVRRYLLRYDGQAGMDP